MSLVVHTAQIRYAKAGLPDALDVTRVGAWQARKDGLPAPGEFLAPSWDLIRDAKDGRIASEEEYDRRFLVEMRLSYVRHRADWQALLARPRVVLCCYEPWPEHCHRHLLRMRVLPALGAIDGGEVAT